MAKTNVNVLPLAIGLFLVILLMGVSTTRSARPNYDGTDNDFSMSIQARADRAEVGDIYWVDVTVRNNDNEAGGQYAQCSILDQEDFDWLAGLSQAVILGEDTGDNCVGNEPFTQTARVDLAASGANATESFRFQFQVPDVADGSPVLYCSMYERCWTPTTDPLYDARIKIPITVVEADGDSSNDNTNNLPAFSGDQPEYPCTLNMDCPNYLFGSIECYEGYCMDSEDVPREPKGPSPISDVSLRGWISENKIFVAVLAISLIIIGLFGIRPKKLNLPRI